MRGLFVSALLGSFLIAGLAEAQTGTSGTSPGKSPAPPAPKAMNVLRPGVEAPDFPPGVFTDGGHYSMPELKGQAVALFFFEPGCPTCRGKIPERNAVVKAMAGKPVKFIAICANASPLEAAQYQRSTNLQMTVFADNLGIMQERYGFKISLQNIWQFRIIDAAGKVNGFNLDEQTISQVIDKAPIEQKFMTMNLDSKFVPVLDLLECGQFPIAMKQVSTFKKTAKKNDLLAVNQIQDVVKKETEKWAEDAASSKESDPIKAHDLYAKIAASLPTEDAAAKSATASMKKLESSDKSVKAEMTARTAYQGLVQKMAMLPPTAKPVVAHALADIARKYGDAPTAVRAQALVDELGGDPSPPKKK
jgi:peroxiredoxin